MTRTLPDSCPICGGQTASMDFDNIPGTCEECGYIPRADQPTPAWLADSDDGKSNNTKEAWESACQIRNSTEKQLKEAFGAIEQLNESINVDSSVRMAAAEVYTDAFIEGLTDGRQTLSFVASCLRIGSIKENYPIPIKRIQQVPDVESTKFARGVKALYQHPDIDRSRLFPTDYLEFFKRQLELHEEQVSAAKTRIDDAFSSAEISGKDPAGIAAAGLYVSTESLTQADVANAAGLSVETIRKRAKQFRKHESE